MQDVTAVIKKNKITKMPCPLCAHRLQYGLRQTLFWSTTRAEKPTMSVKAYKENPN